ncbi:MAG: DUF411 domain-containing protein [Burkholderiales bacterium]
MLKLLVLAAAVAVPVYASQAGAKQPQPAGQAITVYRTATCGCCGKWVDHLKAAGFAPAVHIVERTDAAPPAKGVPPQLRSCHSATLDGYNVEGHVPADVIKQLLKDRPKVQGIAVPGMPAGSPGMESANPVAYDVIAYDAAGKTSVFKRVEPRR